MATKRVVCAIAVAIAGCRGARGDGDRGEPREAAHEVARVEARTGGEHACAGDPAATAAVAPAYVAPAIPNGTFAPTAAHPRIFWTAERLARARAWVAKTGYRPKDDNLLDQAMYYAATKDAAAGKRVADYLQHVVTARQFDSQDDVRWFGEIAIVGFDWAYDAIPAKLRADFAAYANAAFPKWNANEWGGVGHEEGNYYWGYLRNGLLWALASGPENPTSASLLEDALVTRWEKSFLPYARTRQLGGVPTEGTQYGRYQEDYPLYAFTTLATGGRRIFDETDWYRGAVYYNIYNALPGITHRGPIAAREMFPMQDDEFWLQGNSAVDEPYGNFMTAMAWQWPDKLVGQHARWYLDTIKPKRDPAWAGADAGGTRADVATTLPLDYYAPGPGYLWVRGAWAQPSTVLFAALGYARGAGHQHLDAGTFQIWRGGRWLSRETAAYIDEVKGYRGQDKVAAREGIGHNAVLFGGRGGAAGYWDGFPEVVRLESRKDYAYAATELSKWYRASTSNHTDRDDNPYAKTLVRELVYVRALETLVVLDRYETSSASLDRRDWSGPKLAAPDVPRTFVLHAEQDAKVATAGAITTIVAGDQALRVTTLVPKAATVRVVDERLKPTDDIGQQRLEIDGPLGAAQGYFLHVLQAKDAKGADVTATVDDRADAFAITLVHPARGSATITFAKGMASTGGTIATPGCAAHPLATTVQAIHVTDAGPQWGP